MVFWKNWKKKDEPLAASERATAKPEVRGECQHDWEAPLLSLGSRADINFSLTGSVCAKCGLRRIYEGPAFGYRYLPPETHPAPLKEMRFGFYRTLNMIETIIADTQREQSSPLEAADRILGLIRDVRAILKNGEANPAFRPFSADYDPAAHFTAQTRSTQEPPTTDRTTESPGTPDPPTPEPGYEEAYQAINRLARFRIGVHDYESCVACLRTNYRLVFGEDSPLTDPQDMIQRLAAEIQNLRRLNA